MRNKKNIILIILIALFAAVLVYLMFRFNHAYRQNYRYIVHYINSFGKFAVIVYIFIFIIRTLLIVFPYSLMVILGGSLFGTVYGLIYSMISVFISATFAYYTSKFLGKDFVQKLLKGKIRQLDSKVEQHGFKIIFLMRISSIFPYDILSFAAGLTKVKYRDFILGTLLGVLPETFSLTYLGYNLKNPFSRKFIFAVVILILTIAVPIIYTKYRGKKETGEK